MNLHFLKNNRTSDMRTEKSTLPTNFAPRSNPSTPNALRVTKVECEGPNQFAIHVRVVNRSGTTVILCGDPTS